MDATLMLARVLGAYFLIAGLGVVVRRRAMGAFVRRFREDEVLAFISGVLALLLGLTVLALHWEWGDAVSAGITVIGLIAALKGALLIIVGPRLAVLARPFDENLHLAAVWGVVAMLIGAALLFAGFRLAPGGL